MMLTYFRCTKTRLPGVDSALYVRSVSGLLGGSLMELREGVDITGATPPNCSSASYVPSIIRKG